MNFIEGPGFKPHEQPQRESSLSRAGNTVQIVKPEGKYTVVYGNHFQEQSVKQLPEDLDCLVLETGNDKEWVENPTKTMGLVESDLQYFSIHQNDKTRSFPIIFAEPTFETELYSSFESLQFGIETVLGFKLIKDSLPDLKVTRREFLRGVGKLAAGAWLSAPLVSKMTLPFSQQERTSEPSIEFTKVIQRSHPELEIMKFKLFNKVIAHKEQYLMEKYGYSHIGTVMGAAHVLIEDDIQKTPEERLAYLNRLKPLIKKIVIPETFYKIAINTYDNGQWESKLVTVPDLKELITN